MNDKTRAIDIKGILPLIIIVLASYHPDESKAEGACSYASKMLTFVSSAHKGHQRL